MAKHAVGDAKRELFWRRMIRQQASSGMTIRSWCRQQGLSEARFYWWRRELTRRKASGDRLRPVRSPATRRKRYGPESPRSGGKAPEAAFVPVSVVRDSATSDDGRIEIVLADGRCVRLLGSVDRQLLVDVLGILEIPAC
jgi:hypothetical protein